MLFGEIIEPTSRALWEDDYIEYPTNEEPRYEWDSSFSIPEVINKLFICESSKILQIINKCVIATLTPLYQLTKANTQIYKLENDCYVITYKADSNIIVGKVTEKLMPFIKATKKIYVLTSNPILVFQNINMNTREPCMIRFLSTKKAKNPSYVKLEVPNVLTGLSASILSYCEHEELNCTLYVALFDEVPLDSLNSQPFLNLLQNLKVPLVQKYVMKKLFNYSNLYL